MERSGSSVFDFLRLVVTGGAGDIARRLAEQSDLATAVLTPGATRHRSRDFFFTEIRHYAYAGDTALHLAAAAFRRPVAELLVRHGAHVGARNRRKAEPLHYAADANHWDPAAQADTIKYLTSAGSDLNAVDMDGTAPLHRAVRTRSSSAVQALLESGANPLQRNGSGSTPLHLAVQPTGKSGSGSQRAREEQTAIVRLLLEHGATLMDRDGHGKQVREVATGKWVQALLAG